MKDVTFGVKVPEELRDQLNEMMKGSGLVGREFMQQLVDSYLLDKKKQEIPEMAEEIKELQSLTHRINEMYLYLGTRFENIASLNKKKQEDMDQILAEKEGAYEKQLGDYQAKIEDGQKQLEDLKEKIKTLEKSNETLAAKVDEVKGHHESYKELSGQYKEKINQLTGQLADLQALKEENTKLVTSKKQLQENNDNLASDLWFAKREIEKLNNQLIKKQKETDRYIQQLKDQYHLEKQTSILDLQVKHQKDIERLNSKMANIQEEYQDKLKELIFQIEDKKQEKVEKED